MNSAGRKGNRSHSARPQKTPDGFDIYANDYEKTVHPMLVKFAATAPQKARWKLGCCTKKTAAPFGTAALSLINLP